MSKTSTRRPRVASNARTIQQLVKRLEATTNYRSTRYEPAAPVADSLSLQELFTCARQLVVAGCTLPFKQIKHSK